MRILIALSVLLLLVACADDNAITGKVLDVRESGDSEPVEEPKAQTEDTLKQDVPEAIQQASDVPTYDLKGECTVDSKGVVRYFDENGKKTVYRDECVGGIVIHYACDGKEVTSHNEVCDGACKQGAYGDHCI